MTKPDEHTLTPAESGIRRSTLVTILCDVALILALVACLLNYITRNNTDTFNQNVESITNIATAKSSLMLSALENSSHEVKSAYRYCGGLSVREILDYLSLICDQDSEYQLLCWDESASAQLYHVYSGYSTRRDGGEYLPVQYENTDLSVSLHAFSEAEPGEICFSQSFTNCTDALRYFAVFCGIQVEGGEGQRWYLVKPQKESRVLDQLQSYSQYKDLTTAIIYADGKYMAGDSVFRSSNFYDYLYTYNDLSMDQRNAVRDQVRDDENGVGCFTFLDHMGRESVFAYAVCGQAENWYVLVSVPQSEFVSGQLLTIFPLIIIIFLAVLLVFNIWRLLLLVRQLRGSVERERVASLSKSSFLSRISHEIRTPLNAVIGYNLIAREELAAAEDEQSRRHAEMQVMDCLVKSDIASKHLLTLINDVLDMSSIESGKLKVARERFDFKGLVTSLTTVFYSQAKAKGVDFSVSFDSVTEEWFVGDQIRVSQVLTNLLSNAVKFTAEGGTVRLHIRQEPRDDQTARLYFAVTDTGIGMTEEALRRIWSPFEQADSSITRRFGGTGLGLAITKNLVELMGGSIAVESVPEQGSTFSVTLDFGRTEQPQSDESRDFSRVNALAVDDDPGTCEYLRLLFSRCGAQCAALTSGTAAVETVSAALARGQRIDLCLVDWRMPGMDGIETIRCIRALVGPELPIFVLTAYDYGEVTRQAEEVGVTRFLQKPLFQSSLLELLTSLGGGGAAEAGPAEEKPDFAGARVLLAEDNAMNMEIAKRILSAAGLTVECAWNGREAVALFAASPPGDYIAILMDVHMPEMDGHEATRLIRALTRPDALTVPIIAMTADAFAENVAESLAAGMNDHIAKPIDVPALFAMLKKYIRRD